MLISQIMYHSLLIMEPKFFEETPLQNLHNHYHVVGSWALRRRYVNTFVIHRYDSLVIIIYFIL